MYEQKDTGIAISSNVPEDAHVQDTDRGLVDEQTRPVQQDKDDRNSASVKNIDSDNKEESVFKYDFSEYCDITNGEKSEIISSSNRNSLAEDLYDGDIAQIYLGESAGSMDNAKNSGGSDSNLSEMTSSFGPVEDAEADAETHSVSEQKHQDSLSSEIESAVSGIENIQEYRSELSKQSNNLNDTKKRPLSPSFIEDETGFEIKRIKSEPMPYSNHNSNVDKSSNSEPVVDLCPPVAVVAPLGFCEDILTDTLPMKNSKEEPDYVKTDITSILDSLEQSDDKSSSFFDAVFEKMKTDIIDGNSFKTLDGNNWTFDGKSSNGVDYDSKDMLKNAKERSVNSELKRTNSFEHDIEDFEKVLSSVIAKANKIPKTNESLGQKLGGVVPVSGVQASVPHKQCQQPCNHVANSDLLRELLDQKTESNDKQTKARQEIDLSFLHSDLISGKGLSVSSDKILQTRTIDPRLTCFPHVEKPSSVNQTKYFSDESRANNQMPNATKLLEDDYMSLAEQRRASVTLHHKVPSQTLHMNPQGNVSHDDSSEGSNIIKEAFDFATEISGCANDENESALSRQQGFTNGSFYSGQKNENYLNRNHFDHTLKVDLTQNHQTLRNPRMQDMRPGNGLLTFANPSGVRSPETNLPPQLAGPFMNSAKNSVPGPQDIRTQSHINQRSVMFSKHAENMSAHVNSEMQQFSTQNPNMVNANPMKHSAIGQMDPLQSSGLAHRQNRSYMTQNPSAGYPMNNAAYSGHMSRNGTHGPEEKAQNFRYEAGHPMSHTNRAFLPSENNFAMGMQERIRAMNVQQWYRRRVQAQMNRPVHPHAQQMMRHPMVQGQAMGSHKMMQGQSMGQHAVVQGQGMGSHPVAQTQGMGAYQMSQGCEMGLQSTTMGAGHRVKPAGHVHQELGSAAHQVFQGQNMDPRLRAMQMGHISNQSVSGNHKMHQNTFAQGQGQIKLENQSQGHVQYRQQINQLSRTPDAEVPSPIQVPKAFSADMFIDNTNTNTVPSRGNLNQQDAFSSQPAQEMFLFDV